jgi:hypothetical protein
MTARLRNTLSFTFAALLTLTPAATLAQPGAPSARPTTAPKAAIVPDQPGADSNFPATQEQLLKLLKLSPTLTEVVVRDPSLLANQDYVNHNNPELGQFLSTHPQIARNPQYYLFTHLPPGSGSNEEALERKLWPEMMPRVEHQSQLEFLIDHVGPFLIFLAVAGALLWLVRTLMEHRRWTRIFRLQTEVHGRLIERFGTSQELLTYMQTEAGARFLKAAPIPVNPEQTQALPNAVSRILTSLQVGTILTLLGLGFYLMRHNNYEYTTLCELLAVFTLMPGIGCIISAAATWILAGKLGLVPGSSTALATTRHTPDQQ